MDKCIINFVNTIYGNWVNYHGLPYKVCGIEPPRHRQEVQFDNHYKITLVDNNGKEICVTEDCINPIEISEKYLTDSGWYLDDEDGEYMLDDGTIITYGFYDGHRFTIDSKLMYYELVIWSVHELQNALRCHHLYDLADNLIVKEIVKEC